MSEKNSGEKMRFLALHGSPGSEQDFEMIRQNLSLNFKHPIDWVIPFRYAPANHPIDNSLYLNHYQLVIGHSWGCAEYLLNQEQISASHVVLISPFVFGKKRESNLKIFLMKLPFFKKAIHQGIQKFLISSSSPSEIPQRYRVLQDDYAKNLISAMKEKRMITEENIIQKREASIHQKKSVISIIWGEEDNISFYENQISPLLKLYPDSHLYKIKNGGHALPWTHNKEVASIIQKIITHKD